MAIEANVDHALGDVKPSASGEGRIRGYAARREASFKVSAQRRGAAERPEGFPIDHAHLDRYTLGDRDLEREILNLFAGEAPRTLARIRSALPPGKPGALAVDGEWNAKEWQAACHTLKGSARAVGAWRLAAAAEEAERQKYPPVDDPAAAAVAFASTETALDEALAYIATL